jgi:hypothetical protein
MKRRQYYQRTVKRHYGGELRGLAHRQLFRQRGQEVVAALKPLAIPGAAH